MISLEEPKSQEPGLGRTACRKPLVRALVAVLLMALMLLADPSAAKGAVLKGVQSGTATSTGNGTVTVNITSVDTSKAFLIFQTRHSSNRPGGFMLRGRIASSTTLEFTRVTPESSTINIQWYVVEYLSGVKVQHGTVSQGTQATINVPITAVSAISQAFILWSKTPHPSDTVWSGDDPLTAELTTTTNLQFKIGQVISDQHEIAWQVVEFTDAADILVQKGTTSLTGSNLSTDVTLPTGVDINRTFLLVGYRSTGTGADIGRRMMRAQLINSTTLRLDRAVGHSSDPLSEIIWHAIELKDGSTTQRGTANLASGAASAAVSISPIDPTRSVAFSAVQPVGGQNLGMSSYVGDDILGVGSATMELTSNTLTLRRNSTVAATDIGYFVVQFPSPLTPANVPYAHDFESAMGAEWSDTTRTSNGTYTNFAGRYHNSSLKLALNTTPGEVYRLLFDFYAVDSWDGNESGNGPDAFVISVNGSTVFNHTFDHQWPGDGMSYPYPYDQKGHYGFNGSFEDGIYRKVEVVFTAPSSVSTISFTGQLTGGGGISDESWGIDNVAVGTARFKDVSSTKGFNVQTSSAETYGTSMHWGDLDNDGDLDCIATGNTAKLLLNNNAGQSFTSSTFGGADVRRAGALVDLDHDGDLDFWAAAINGYDAERFFQNSGSASFSDQGNLGLSGPSNNENVAAADVNGDGWCDIVMLSGNNGNWIGHHQGGGTPALTQTKSSSYGLNDSGDYGNGEYSSTGDVNNDNLPDFFYHYDSGKLFVSDGDGTYTENTHGISVVANGVDKFGSAWGDYDNDGDLDLFAARVTETCTGYLWRNDRDWAGATDSFTNVTTAAAFNLNTSMNYSTAILMYCWPAPTATITSTRIREMALFSGARRASR